MFKKHFLEANKISIVRKLRTMDSIAQNGDYCAISLSETTCG